MSAVSVLLPVTGAGTGLAEAVSCLQAQSLRNFELLLLLNGASPSCATTARDLAGMDDRIRVVELEERGLARALNAGLARAKGDLVARMDADDWCHPERLERQRDFMAAHPEMTVLGTAFEGLEIEGPAAGERIGVERPATDPAEVRWRLLLGNTMCHGSVMMRREAVLGAGGYDVRVPKAQDYELWLRLSRAGLKIGNLPDVLYRYSTSRFKRDETQARFAAGAMIGAWAELPAADASVKQTIESLVASATWGGSAARRGIASIEALLSVEGPSREAMFAWWWCAQRAGRLGLSLTELTRLSRVRAAGEQLSRAGACSVWLYGAGRHTRWLFENLDELGIPVRGVIDDARAGDSVGGYAVQSPDDVAVGEHVLISSDAQEAAIWERCIGLRARAVRVWRMYDSRETPPANRLVAA